MTSFIAIIVASENGHIEVVKILLSDKRVDPSSDYNEGKWKFLQ
jgi:hypothetical protein